MQYDVVRTRTQFLKLLFLDLLVLGDLIGRATHALVRVVGLEKQERLAHSSIVVVNRQSGEGYHASIEVDTGLNPRVLLAGACGELGSCRVSHGGKPLQVDRAGQRELLLVEIELRHAIDDEANVGRALADPDR